MFKRVVTPNLMKAMNRTMVIDILAKEGPVSQTQITEITGLSRATVSILINELKQENLVIDVRKQESTGGRRQVLLRLDEKAGFVVGVDLGGTKMAGAVTDLSGKPLTKMRWPTRAEEGPEAVLGNLLEFIGVLIEKSGIDRTKVRGLGIGVPGIVKPGGIVAWAPALGWRDLRLVDELAGRFPYPAFVENDVNLLALGEYWYGGFQGLDPLVCLAVGTGIGAGVVLNGQLHNGAHQAAGEVCNLVVDRSFLAQDFSQYGCLESMASGPALAKQFAAGNTEGFEANTPPRVDANGTGLGEQTLTGAEAVFAEARKQNPQALQVIEEFTKCLAMAIIAIATVIDPEIIILGGGVSQNADLFRDRLLRLCSPVIQVMPRLEVSSLGVDAGVMGAVALTLHNTSEDPWR